MRVRAQDANGDYTFGQSGANFLVNSAAAVAQTVLTRLLLLQGEWFLDSTEGTPYATDVLGVKRKVIYDRAIKARILATNGVEDIISYLSTLSPQRKLAITAEIDTVFGPITITTALNQYQQ